MGRQAGAGHVLRGQGARGWGPWAGSPPAPGVPPRVGLLRSEGRGVGVVAGTWQMGTGGGAAGRRHAEAWPRGEGGSCWSWDILDWLSVTN